MGKMEYKKFSFEFKEFKVDEKFIYIDGYASTNDKDFGDDIVEQNALIESVKKYGLPKFLHQHSHTQMPLGTVYDVVAEGNKTLIKTRMPVSIRASEVQDLVKDGAYGGFSIGFRSKTVELQDVDKEQIRIIKEIHWYEVSLVSIPMNPHATITNVKSIESIEKLSEVEKTLQEKGFSKKESLTLISKIKEFTKPSDSVKKTEQKESDSIEAKQKEDNKLLELVDKFSKMIKEI